LNPSAQIKIKSFKDRIKVNYVQDKEINSSLSCKLPFTKMSGLIQKLIEKLYHKQWIIGICKGDIKDIILTKSFDPEITWIPVKSFDNFHADPFLFITKNGNINIFFEDFDFNKFYGKIKLVSFDKNLKLISEKVLLDTGCHFSYPFIFEEDNRIYVFPESAQSGGLFCYEYDPKKQSLNLLKQIIDLPLLDSTILKYEDKYWLFATMKGQDPYSKLHIYFSENLFGPYNPHHDNPVKNSLIGSRPAGNFIKINGIIYRPTQNCVTRYGDSITINKVNVLNEHRFEEEPIMLISLNKNRHSNRQMHTIHTLNFADQLIVVDGMKWTFSPFDQWRTFIRNRRLERQLSVSKYDIRSNPDG